MKTNRLTFFVCSALVVVCAIAYLLSAEGLSIEVFQNLLMGITTGAIISVVISLIGYFRDRDALVFKATNTSVNAYIDLSVLRELTGYALGSIGHTEKMRDIPLISSHPLPERLLMIAMMFQASCMLPSIRAESLQGDIVISLLFAQCFKIWL